MARTPHEVNRGRSTLRAVSEPIAVLALCHKRDQLADTIAYDAAT
jgi:hypothetical protein